MIGLEVQVGAKQIDGSDRESPRRRVFARSLVAAIVAVAIGYAAPAARGAEVTFGAPDLDFIHPNFVDCDDGEPTTGPDPCSIVSKSSGFGASNLFATPFGGTITSMTVRQPQTSEIPGGGGAPVSQAISIQVFAPPIGPPAFFGGGRIQQVGGISGAGIHTLAVKPPFIVDPGELIGLRLDPFAEGPFYLNFSGPSDERTNVWENPTALGEGQIRFPNNSFDGILPVQFTLFVPDAECEIFEPAGMYDFHVRLGVLGESDVPRGPDLIRRVEASLDLDDGPPTRIPGFVVVRNLFELKQDDGSSCNVVPELPSPATRLILNGPLRPGMGFETGPPDGLRFQTRFNGFINGRRDKTVGNCTKATGEEDCPVPKLKPTHGVTWFTEFVTRDPESLLFDPETGDPTDPVEITGFVTAPCTAGLEISCINNRDSSLVDFVQSSDSSIGRLSARKGFGGKARKPPQPKRGARAQAAGSGGSDLAPRRVRIALLRLGGKLRGFKGVADPSLKLPKVKKSARAGREAQAAKKKARCRWLKSKKAKFKQRKPTGRSKRVCNEPVWLKASGKRKWSFKLARPLPPGRYVLYSRVTNGAGAIETSFTKKDRNRREFRVGG